jgi:hypothetical protein
MPSKSTKSDAPVAKTAKTKVGANPAGSGNRKAAAGKSTKPPATNGKRDPVLSTEAIALRAYFIAEKRRSTGDPGDQLGDWIEAERQLIIEAKAK